MGQTQDRCELQARDIVGCCRWLPSGVLAMSCSQRRQPSAGVISRFGSDEGVARHGCGFQGSFAGDAQPSPCDQLNRLHPVGLPAS